MWRVGRRGRARRLDGGRHDRCRRDARRRDERGRTDGNAGAWAAAAAVLGLGALGFGVVAQLRVSDLESRLDQIEVAASTPVTDEADQPDVTTTTLEATTTSVARFPESEAEARASVLHAYDVVFDGSSPGEQRLRFIDDPTGVEAAFAVAGGGQFAAQSAALRVRVDEVTFTDAAHATVRYVLITNGVAQIQQRIGTAVLVGGTTWKVTRETVCADLEAAGAPCGSV